VRRGATAFTAVVAAGALTGSSLAVIAGVLLTLVVLVVLLGVVLPGVWASAERRRAALNVLRELRQWLHRDQGESP
jgi:hypothetical protein